MSEIKLKSCPFCGGEAELQKGICELDNYVMCLECRSKTKLYNTKESAIKAWNTRKPMQDIVERLEEYGSIWVQYQEIMTKEEIAESVLKQAKEQCIRIVKEVGGIND